MGFQVNNKIIMKEFYNGGSDEESLFLKGPVETCESTYIELRKIVEECYLKHDVNKKLIGQFVKHNEQVEEFVEKFSKKKRFSKKEKEIATLAAILHDITKGWGDFLNHGKEGGRIAKEILTSMNISEELAESVKLAIERHMGQEGYPTDLAKKEYGNDFEYPKYATKVGQLVYECDILTQLTEDGFNKILLLRETDKEDRKEDEARAEKDGISIEEARIKSVLESAKKSYGLIEIDSIAEHATELWEKIEKEYSGYSF